MRHQFGVVLDILGEQSRIISRECRQTSVDRFSWVILSRVWDDWRSALAIVKPETVIGWHRKGFRLFWTWKVRRGKPGRPAVSREVRDLIRRISRENPLWGAPHIVPTIYSVAVQTETFSASSGGDVTTRLGALLAPAVTCPRNGLQNGVLAERRKC
jgi:hypothetical protein